MNLRITVAEDFAPVRKLRMAVFVDEQGFTEEAEFDTLDTTAVHLLVWNGETPIGCARLYMAGDEGRIGRICVRQADRGRGIGAALVEAGLAHFRDRGVSTVALGAQVRAQGFYESLGFVTYGAEYDDEGVPHRMMRRAL